MLEKPKQAMAIRKNAPISKVSVKLAHHLAAPGRERRRNGEKKKMRERAGQNGEERDKGGREREKGKEGEKWREK